MSPDGEGEEEERGEVKPAQPRLVKRFDCERTEQTAAVFLESIIWATTFTSFL